ncbi:hypothetical protein [Corynebacterium comes]|uniref:Uncharacterized protein n=1 Tax=Corynebacterium comes TaxID=2675218 RepID=A0A6B8VW57_9CORY|nr:hypothetical protein [Corynebacterium comes]QGU05574.1 hypothetical protein CETAM_11710 [Corynebacterium comes]
MTDQDSFEGLQGGFTRPQFSPGSGVPGPRGSTSTAGFGALDATRVEVADLDDQLHRESREEDGRRRRRLGIAIGSAILAIAVIVFAMVRLWADDRWGLLAALV